MNFLSLLYAFLFFSPALAIWPRPQNLTTGTTPLRLAPNFAIKFSGIRNVPRDLSDAARRTTNFLKTDKLQALVPDRGASSSGAVHSASTLRSLTLSLAPSAASNGAVKDISDEVMSGVGTQDESYDLQVPSDGGNAVLTANSALGLFRGLTTFEQLWYDLDGATYTLQAPIQVKDAPTYVSGYLTLVFMCLC